MPLIHSDLCFPFPSLPVKATPTRTPPLKINFLLISTLWLLISKYFHCPPFHFFFLFLRFILLCVCLPGGEGGLKPCSPSLSNRPLLHHRNCHPRQSRFSTSRPIFFNVLLLFLLGLFFFLSFLTIIHSVGFSLNIHITSKTTSYSLKQGHKFCVLSDL